jgi:hypothetical protein
VRPSSQWQASDYQATVDWGDGSHSTASIVGDSNGCASVGPSSSLVLASCFDVQPPAHAYASVGVDEYMVHLRRSDGATSDFSGEAEVSGSPTVSLTTKEIKSRTGVLTWLRPNGGWFGCTATVLHSRSRELIVTAAHCGVPEGHTTALWFAPGFNVSGGVCPEPPLQAALQQPGLPDLTTCPMSDIPYGVWIGGTVVPNPSAGGESGYGGSNDQTFVRLDGTHCADASANCDETHPEDVVGGDFIDFFYWQLTRPLTFPAPVNGATFGYPIDLGAGASPSTQTFAQTLQVCANRQGTTNPFTDTALQGLVPQPGFALANCSYNGQNVGQCQWSLNPPSGCRMAGVSGSPYVTDDGPLADAVAAVNTGIAPDTKQNHFDCFAGVAGLITALTYLEADGIPPQ